MSHPRRIRARPVTELVFRRNVCISVAAASDQGRRVFAEIADMTVEALIAYFPFRRIDELTTGADLTLKRSDLGEHILFHRLDAKGVLHYLASRLESPPQPTVTQQTRASRIHPPPKDDGQTLDGGGVTHRADHKRGTETGTFDPVDIEWG